MNKCDYIMLGIVLGFFGTWALSVLGVMVGLRELINSLVGMFGG